jgi:DNA repair exonuclease SbcCD ATPase subunit
MDLEQLQKRIQWIEEDRRKEKDAIALLESRLLAFEGSISAVSQQIKDLSGEVTRLSAIVTRMDQYDQTLLQLRIEAKRQVEELDKEIKQRLEETDKVRRVEVKALDSSLADVRKELELIPKLEKGIQTRVDEENRLRRSIEELKEHIEAVRLEEEEYTRTYRLLEDGRRQDAKRIVDLQGEVAALRKRGDDLRGQSELVNTSLKKVETRLNELSSVEAERRDAMVSFLDKQALTQVERERVWKEWQTRFETIEKQSSDVEGQLLSLDTTHRETKRAQVALDDLAQRVERRISEISEIQRLSEDRFRQEWVTFKADDQKRWTNYTLTQEEQRNETIRRFERLAEQATHLEDELQDVKDVLEQANELAEKRLQSLLAIAHEWVSAYERSIGRSQ